MQWFCLHFLNYKEREREYCKQLIFIKEVVQNLLHACARHAVFSIPHPHPLLVVYLCWRWCCAAWKLPPTVGGWRRLKWLVHYSYAFEREHTRIYKNNIWFVSGLLCVSCCVLHLPIFQFVAASSPLKNKKMLLMDGPKQIKKYILPGNLGGTVWELDVDGISSEDVLCTT